MGLGLIVVIGLVCASIFVNGWTDAPNAITTVVSTRVLSPKAAVGLAAVFNLLGVLVMGTAVAQTISGIAELQNLSTHDALVMFAAAQVAIVSWAVGAWKFGIPTSESHALIAGLTGAALASGAPVSGGAWIKIVEGLVISSVLGFVSGWVLTVIVGKTFGRMKKNTANRFFSFGQIASASAMAFSHGAQDGQKFMGVLASVLTLGGIIDRLPNGDIAIPLWIMLFCSAVMALGTSVGGYRIIKTMGMDMVKIEKYQGFSAEIGASACMIGATIFGIPLSTTNSKGTAIMGAAAARRLSNVNWGIVKEMVTAWILTFPCCAIIGYLMALLFRAIF
jgi:inorganic phosphate transporter, PiT family